MNKIIVHERIGTDVYRMVIEAEQIARKRKAGQFVMIRLDDQGERIPLTIADSSPDAGTITLIYQAVGKTTEQLTTKEVGGYLQDVVGPLGQATHIENFGTAVCVGGGIGKAPLFPIAQALKLAGNKVIAIVGARGKDLIILEDEIRVVSDELIVCTDDGSHGRKALVTVAAAGDPRARKGGPLRGDRADDHDEACRRSNRAIRRANAGQPELDHD